MSIIKSMCDKLKKYFQFKTCLISIISCFFPFDLQLHFNFVDYFLRATEYRIRSYISRGFLVYVDIIIGIRVNTYQGICNHRTLARRTLRTNLIAHRCMHERANPIGIYTITDFIQRLRVE
jgi:hypothetical protein